MEAQSTALRGLLERYVFLFSCQSSLRFSAKETRTARGVSLPLCRSIGAFSASRDRDDEGQLLRKSLRALIVIITHVDACGDQDAGAVFEAMWTRGVGIGRALLYEGWAVIRERSKNYEAAEEIYQMGLRNASKACEETFEATLRKGLRELTQRRRKRGVSGGQGAPAAKRPRKRAEKKGYMQELLATDDGDEMCFEEWRVLQHSLSAQPRGSPAPPTTTVDITQLMPSPVASPSLPAQAAAPGFSVFVDETASPAAASVAESASDIHEPNVAPTPSPAQSDAAPAVTPTQIYGAETAMLTARDVFSSLQTPPEAMAENLSDILEAIDCSEACVTFYTQHAGCRCELARLHQFVGVLLAAGTLARSATACW